MGLLVRERSKGVAIRRGWPPLRCCTRGKTKLKETKRDSDASRRAISDTGDSHLNPMITSLCRLGSLESFDDKSRESDDDKC